MAIFDVCRECTHMLSHSIDAVKCAIYFSNGKNTHQTIWYLISDAEQMKIVLWKMRAPNKIKSHFINRFMCRRYCLWTWTDRVERHAIINLLINLFVRHCIGAAICILLFCFDEIKYLNCNLDFAAKSSWVGIFAFDVTSMHSIS